MNSKAPVNLPDGYIDFFMQLESWQNEQQILLQKQFPAPPPIDFDFKNLSDSLINLLEVDIDANAYASVYSAFIAFLMANRTEMRADLEKIEQNMAQFDWLAIIEETMNENGVYFTALADLYNLNPEVAFFTFEHSLRPFLRAFASPYYEKWIEVGITHWPVASHCPFCGSEGHISRLRNEDGRRFMFCERCFSEWEVRYLFCIHCANDEPGTIRIMNLENDPAHKLYVCDKCKSYLKTYDERQTLQPADMFITSLETIYLDMLAREQGYGGKNTPNN